MSEDKKVQPITRANFVLAESKRTNFCAIILHGTTLKDMKQHDYFSNVARKISLFDRIEARAEDDTWWAELLVTYSMAGAIKFEVLNYFELVAPSANAVTIGGYTIKWAGSVKKHQVIRNSDKVVVKDCIPRKTEAIVWLEQYERNLAA